MQAAEYRVFAVALQDAEELYRVGRHRDAFDAYEQLLRSRLAAPADGGAALTTVSELVVVERLAQLSLLMGLAAATDLLLKSAAALCRNAGNAYAAAYYTLLRAATALDTGRLHDVRERLAEMVDHIGDIEAIDITPGGLAQWESSCDWRRLDAAARAVVFARLYGVMGGLLAALGQYAQALHCLRRGAVHAGPVAPELARCVLPHLQLAAAGAELERGELTPAQAMLEQWRSVADDFREPALAANWLGLASKIALLEGRHGRALELLERLVAAAGAARLSRAQAIAELNLAQLRIMLNQTAAARTLVETAAERAAALRDPHLERRAEAMSRLAEVRASSWAEWVALTPAVTQMWRPADDAATGKLATVGEPAAAPSDWPEPAPARSFLDLFEDRALRVQWRLGQGDLEGAGLALHEMEAAFADTDSELIAVRLQVLRALITYYAQLVAKQPAWGPTEARLAEACERLRRLGLRAELWQALRIRVWAGRRAGRSDELTQPWSDEADALLARMSNSLGEAARAIYLLNKWNADEEALAGRIDALVALRRQQLAAPWWRRWAFASATRLALARLLWRIDRYKAQVGQREVGGSASDGGPAEPSLVAAWRRRPGTQATVSMLVLPDRTLVAATCGWRTWFGVSPVTRLQWREAVESFHQALRDATDAHHEPRQLESLHDVLARCAEQLGSLLQLPGLLAQLPAGVRRLRFVPDDILHAIPFAAVRVAGRPIVESHAVCIDFEIALRSRGSVQPRRDRTALLLGIGKALGLYPALPGAAGEVAGLQPVLVRQGWTPTSLIDERGTPEAVQAALPAVGLAHLACHGVFDADRPGDSGLVLPGGTSLPERRLTLREIARLDLSSLRHAGLSACWSADQVVVPGRHTIGLPETLRRCGAHSVLAWLWPAPDRYAAALTTRFYELLATQRRDEALRQVHADALAGAFAEHLPADLRGLPLWAGLQLYGDSSALHA